MGLHVWAIIAYIRWFLSCTAKAFLVDNTYGYGVCIVSMIIDRCILVLLFGVIIDELGGGRGELYVYSLFLGMVGV